jgi:hypothetical protein
MIMNNNEKSNLLKNDQELIHDNNIRHGMILIEASRVFGADAAKHIFCDATALFVKSINFAIEEASKFGRNLIWVAILFIFAAYLLPFIERMYIVSRL